MFLLFLLVVYTGLGVFCQCTVLFIAIKISYLSDCFVIVIS